MKLDLTENGSLSDSHIELLNKIADEIKLQFFEMINRIGKGNENNIDWWVSEIASRNTYSNSLFDDCCLLSLVKKVLQEEPDVTEIRVDSYTLKKTLSHYVRQNYPQIKVICTIGWKQKLIFITLPPLRYFYAIFLYCSRYLISKFTLRHFTDHLPNDITLVDVFLFDHSFNGTAFQDRYFGGFDKYLSEKERQLFFYNPTLLISFRKTVAVFKAMRRSQQRFLPQECFLKPSDYIFALLYSFRAIHLFPRYTEWEEFEITPILRSIWYYNLTSISTFEGLLKYRFAARLKEANVALRLVLDWFENQHIDRGSNAGFHKFYPEVPVIGYSSIDLKHYLCMAHPTSAEYEAGVLPQEVAVCGKGYEAAKKAFCPELKTSTAPAFRYDWVWQESTVSPDPNYTTVLVPLSLLRKECLNTIRAVIGAVGFDLPSKVKFWIKPHPAAMPLAVLMEQACLTFPPGFEVIAGDFSEWAEKADIVVGNESGTVLESLARGIPTIIVGHKSRVTIHAIPDAVPQGLCQICYTSEGIAQAIKYFMNRSKEELLRHAEIAKFSREQYFEPNTKERARKFLRLEEPQDCS